MTLSNCGTGKEGTVQSWQKAQKGMEEFFWQDKMVSKAEQRWELDEERKKKEKSYIYESPNCRIAVILYQIASFSFSSLRSMDYLKHWD